MRLYVGDYLADTLHLSTVEHGAYMLLIMAYWQHRGPLPADDASLARITRMSKLQWRKISEKILVFFEKKDGKISHRRIDSEIAHANGKSLKSQKAGLTSAERRSNKRSADDEPRARVPDTIVQKNISPSSNDEGSSPADLFGDVPGDDGDQLEIGYSPEFEEFWKAFPSGVGQFNRKKGKGAAARAYANAIKRLVGKKPSNRPRAVSLLLASAKAYDAVTTGRDRDFFPKPTTWLNENRWTDDAVRAFLERGDDGKPNGSGIDWSRMGK